MLSVVANPEGDVLHIHGDVAGLLRLEREVRRLRELAERGECEDGHLLSESWGAGDLTETMLSNEQVNGWRQVHHVKVFGWSAEWSNRHGLSPTAP